MLCRVSCKIKFELKKSNYKKKPNKVVIKIKNNIKVATLK